MKKIILIVGGIIVIAVLGRLGWAYYQVKSNAASMVNVPASTTAIPSSELVQMGTSSIATSPTMSPVQVFAQNNSLTNSQTLDCKEDLSCFLKAMDNKCALAKLNYTISADSSSMTDNKLAFNVIYKRLFEINGYGSGGNCIIFEKDLGDSFEYDPLKPSQVPQDYKHFIQTLYVGLSPVSAAISTKDDTCKVTSLEFKDHIYRMTHLVILAPNPYMEKCAKKSLPIY